MKREELKAIEAREQAAMPGPWEKTFSSEDYGAGYGMTTFFVKQPDGNLYRIGSGDTSEKYFKENNNAEFIAHARQDVPALITEVKRQNAEIERLTIERDSVVADLRASAPCKCCKHYDETLRGFPCSKCSEKVGNQCSDWEWRGVQT